MNLLRLLRRADPAKLGFSLFLCLIAPAFMVLAYLMGSGPLGLTRNWGPHATYGIAALALTINVVLQSRAVRLYGADFQEALARVRADIVNHLVGSELEVVRQTGATEIASVLDGDGRVVAAVAPALAVVTVYAAWTFVALVIAAHESWIVVLVYVAIFALVYLVRGLSGSTEPAKRGDEAEARFRAVFADLMAAPRTLVIDRKKATALSEAAAKEAREAAKQRGFGGRGFARSIAAAETLMLFAILAAHEISNGIVPGAHVSDSVMLLFIGTSGPFIRVLHSRHELQGADRAARRLLALEAGLRRAPRIAATTTPLPAFAELRLESVTAMRTPRPGEPPFVIGPVNLSIPRGSITVVHGTNGSGKSTLLEVLLGFLRPHTGRLMVDDKVIDGASLDSYRNLFSVVFATPHLFDRLYGHDETRGAAQDKLDWLGLRTLGVDASRAVSEALSTGQRKRLALARALAEGRPILVLDEYTADQDPSARERFHTEILPALKAEGRTVIAVLHGSSIPACADYVARIAKGIVVQEPHSNDGISEVPV